jgi:DHA2 family multidrug resistance protein
MVARGTVLYRSRLSEHLVAGDPRVNQWLSVAGAAVSRRDGDVHSASLRALRLLDAYVTRQAAVLAYNHVYQSIALSFIVLLPLVLLLKFGPSFR